MIRKLLLTFIGAAAIAAPAQAQTQTFPNKPMRLVIGYGAGGITDILNRILAEEMSKKFGQPVVVENRTGAAGLIAAQSVKSAAPDGHTLIGGSASTWHPVFVQQGLVATKDFAPVASFAAGDWMIYAPFNTNVKTIKEFVAYAKGKSANKPRHMSVGGLNHMLLSLVGKGVGMDFEEIRYKTSAEAVAAILSGDGDITINSIAGFEGFMNGNQLRPIATLSAQRSVFKPEVPTVMEQGVNFELRFYQNVFTTLGTPRDAILKLNAAVQEATTNPAVVQRLRNASLVPAYSSPEDLVKMFDAEVKAYGEAAAMTGFKPI